MINYAVVEIAGRQYKVKSGQEFLVDFLGDTQSFESDRVLLISEDGKLELGQPYLKDKLKFQVLGSVRGSKIRVATYKAKANVRRVKGARATYSKVKLVT